MLDAGPSPLEWSLSSWLLALIFHPVRSILSEDQKVSVDSFMMACVDNGTGPGVGASG